MTNSAISEKTRLGLNFILISVMFCTALQYQFYLRHSDQNLLVSQNVQMYQYPNHKRLNQCQTNTDSTFSYRMMLDMVLYHIHHFEHTLLNIIYSVQSKDLLHNYEIRQ